MAYYLCRFIDRSGQSKGEFPIIASSDGDAITMAQSMFPEQEGAGGYELWFGSRCIARHGTLLKAKTG